jgi:predicted ATPase/class 3 adenylate cyclase
MKYCGRCGATLAQVCPHCGFANPLGYRFCGMCGGRLVAEPIVGQPPRPQLPGEAEALALAGPPLKQLEGERRVATVILADVRSSTDLIERLGSEAWVELMNRVFQILEAEIYRFGGQVHQFRGDGLVAFFGATAAHEDDPERAVLAALSMQRALRPYAAELAGREDIDLMLRVGVHTGEVIVTSVGDSQHREDTAMGEAVAVAARLETAAEPGTVLVSAGTYRLVESQFKWQPLGEISVKGLSRPIAVYRPLVPCPEAEWAHEMGILASAAPLSGRVAQFQILKQYVENLRRGRGGIVLVTGEKGMGKSALIAQVRQHFVRQCVLLAEVYGGEPSPAQTTQQPACPTITWLRGTCRSYDQNWPYSVWLDMLQRWLDIRRPDEHSQEARVRLRRQAEALWGDRLAEYYPYLATFLTLDLEDLFAERVRHLDAEALHRRFYLAIRGWVEAMARQGPLVLDFTDLQWADTSSLDLLKYCLPLCDSEALLWLTEFRPDRTSPVWGFRHHVETEYPHRLTGIELLPLNEAESRELIGQIIGPDTLSEETRALVIRKAEGTPYYIREILHTLIEQGVLVRDAEAGTWHETHTITSLDLPDSLQSLLLARIDRLSPEERRVLQMAAVIGPVFWRNVLQALAGDAIPLPGCLTSLQRSQLIHERQPAPDLGMEYAFNSALIRDVAYESLLSAQRAACHLKVAEWLEECVHPEAWRQYGGLIADHYRRAGRPNKELFYTLQAAEQARQVYANAEALGHYTRALELLDKMESEAADEARIRAIRTQRFEVLSGRSAALYPMGDLQAGDADTRALLPLAQQMADDPAWPIDALLAQPEVNHPETRAEVNAGVRMVQEALDRAQQVSDRHREMRSLMMLANLRVILRDPTWHEAAERALEFARQLEDRRTEVYLLLGIGSAYGMDDLQRNMEYLEAALPICQELDDKGTEMRLLSAMGAQFERRGDYYRLLTEYEQKRLQISREIGDRLEEGDALMFCAQIQGLYLGDYQAGLALAEESARIWEEITARLYPLLRIAQMQVALGRYDDALATLERACPLSERNVYDLGRAGIDLVTTILYNTLGDEDHLRMALELTVEIGQMVAANLVSRQYQMAAACESAAAHLGLARCLADEAERREQFRLALESSQTALDIYNSFGFTQVIECVGEEILFRHSLALEANGRQAEAAEYLKAAYEEMMRKYDLIPAGSRFRQTYLENIALHREIRGRYARRA